MKNINTEDLKTIGEHLRPIIEEASKKSFKECMTDLGVDANKPIEMQKDMIFVRKMRVCSDNAGGFIVKSLILGAGVVSFLAYAISDFLHLKGK